MSPHWHVGSMIYNLHSFKEKYIQARYSCFMLGGALVIMLTFYSLDSRLYGQKFYTPALNEQENINGCTQPLWNPMALQFLLKCQVKKVRCSWNFIKSTFKAKPHQSGSSCPPCKNSGFSPINIQCRNPIFFLSTIHKGKLLLTPHEPNTKPRCTAKYFVLLHN